jgi:hypothetical protein
MRERFVGAYSPAVIVVCCRGVDNEESACLLDLYILLIERKLLLSQDIHAVKETNVRHGADLGRFVSRS